MSETSAAGPAVTQIRFVDNVLPPLASAEYTIALEQTVNVDGHVDDDTEPYRHDQRIRVDGPHFELPAGAVFSTYPPAGSSADYSRAVASVVLGARTLPWQIAPGPAAALAGGPLVTPWLALLLLTPDDIVTATAPAAGSVTGAFSVPLADYLSPGDGYVGPDFTDQQVPNPAQQTATDYQCTVVDITAAAFSATAPMLAELPYLAHAREVDTTDQEIAAVEADGWFSVVLGNRLATGSSSGLYLAHLVSVEGFTAALPPTALPSGSIVRLLSLSSWAFTSIPAAGDFAGMMSNLDVGVLAMPNSAPVGASTPHGVVASALADGYTALDYQTRLGERTVAWYRGPCLPVQMAHNEQPGYSAAAGALVYDRGTGMFDTSYAVAWQIGRLSALANRQVVVSLLAWLRTQHARSQQLIGRIRVASRHPLLGLPDEVADVLEPRLASRRARGLVATRLARSAVPAADSAGPLPGAPLLGRPADPSRLRPVVSRTPGLLSDAELRGLATTTDSTVADTARSLVQLLRHKVRAADR